METESIVHSLANVYDNGMTPGINDLVDITRKMTEDHSDEGWHFKAISNKASVDVVAYFNALKDEEDRMTTAPVKKATVRPTADQIYTWQCELVELCLDSGIARRLIKLEGEEDRL